MSKVIGICNLHDDPRLGLLTDHRPCGAVPFLGRYTLIDFTLSNFSNSHINDVYVLIKDGILPIQRHIGSGAIWTNNTKRGHINLLVNESGLFSPKFNTDLANLRHNLSLDETDFDYAVIAPSFMLGCIDYRPIIKAHEESEADVTVVYSHFENADEEFINCDKLKIGASGKILKSETNIGKNDEADISIESFVVSKKFLKKMMNDSTKVSSLYTIRQMIAYYVEQDVGVIKGYKYEGFVLPMLDFEHYVKHSLNLLNYRVRSKLFSNEWPIYTTSHNTPPSLYGKSAEVKNSFIANGSVIKGKVENCIISRDVVIEKGAVVTNCIILPKSVVGKDVHADYVVIDTNAVVSTVKEVEGTEDKPLFIVQGAKI